MPLPGKQDFPDHLGASLASTSEAVLAGASLDAGNALTSGTVVIFQPQPPFQLTGRVWASDGEEHDAFGLSVDACGSRIIVGAPANDDAGQSSGSAYIYDWTNGAAQWEETKLLASDPAMNDHFGRCVAIDGDVSLVSAHADDVACPQNPNCNSGSAYVFRFNGQKWIEEAKLVPSDTAESDGFGFALVGQSDLAVIGAYSKDEPVENHGAVYIFRYDGGQWVEAQKLLQSDGLSYDFFGASVDISGDWILVGAPQVFSGRPGAAYFFQLDPATSQWVERQKVVPVDGELQDHYGISVDINGNRAVVGAEEDDDGALDTGAAYVYELNGDRWEFRRKLNNPAPGEDDFFGHAVLISDDWTFVGAPGADWNGAGSGAAWAFPTDCDQLPGDLDGDGDVDFDDFTQLLASWGDPGCGGALPCPADIDGDGDVDFDDFTTLLANWSS